MFDAAVKVHPDFIGITSFNEWHEGTQIEPAIPKRTGTFKYEDYGKDPWFYIKETKRLTDKFLKENNINSNFILIVKNQAFYWPFYLQNGI
jgi:glycoprotein endo-alpha-1,2-mannosidase